MRSGRPESVSWVLKHYAEEVEAERRSAGLLTLFEGEELPQEGDEQE